MGTSTTIPSLQLELPKFESLTAGTNLPHVAPEDIEVPPPSPPPAEPRSAAAASPSSGAGASEDPLSPPPLSPGRPTSMRRFLSRVSLNSNTPTDDKASIFSTPTIVSSTETKKPKKSSWWKKNSGSSNSSKRLSFMPGASSAAPPAAERKVHAIPPPPRLPDDLFGKNLSSLDGDMFKNFK